MGGNKFHQIIGHFRHIIRYVTCGGYRECYTPRLSEKVVDGVGFFVSFLKSCQSIFLQVFSRFTGVYASNTIYTPYFPALSELFVRRGIKLGIIRISLFVSYLYQTRQLFISAGRMTVVKRTCLVSSGTPSPVVMAGTTTTCAQKGKVQSLQVAASPPSMGAGPTGLSGLFVTRIAGLVSNVVFASATTHVLKMAANNA